MEQKTTETPNGSFRNLEQSSSNKDMFSDINLNEILGSN